jgi:hypothetical protein
VNSHQVLVLSFTAGFGLPPCWQTTQTSGASYIQPESSRSSDASVASTLA